MKIFACKKLFSYYLIVFVGMLIMASGCEGDYNAGEREKVYEIVNGYIYDCSTNKRVYEIVNGYIYRC